MASIDDVYREIRLARAEQEEYADLILRSVITIATKDVEKAKATALSFIEIAKRAADSKVSR